LRVFQWWPFTLTQVLYEYVLPVNFTYTNSFLAGCVFIQPVWCKQCKICIQCYLYTPWDIFYVTEYVTVESFIGRGARLVKLLTMLWNIVTFSQSILSIKFNWGLSVDTRWVVLVQVTMNAPLIRVKLVRAVNRNPDSELGLVLVWLWT